VSALKKAGWTIIEVPSCDQYPDGVFIEDNVVMYKGTALITRPGNDARLGEI
jgi:dimethylargininase